MKLRTIVKIAITSSVVLLCAGFALYSFSGCRPPKEKGFQSLRIGSALCFGSFVTDDILEFVAEVDDLACSKISNIFMYPNCFRI